MSTRSIVTHPYETMPSKAFWHSAVAKGDCARFPGLYTPRIRVTPTTRIATAGSCFAQHIGQFLHLAGCQVLDAEPAPTSMPDAIAKRFGYRLFSGRYGNIYTARQLRQFLNEVADGEADPDFVWHNDGRFRDALRPTVEPDGLNRIEDVLLHRNYHLEQTSRMLQQADLMIFTLGLTEAWVDRATGRVFPICPGVAGGRFDPARHAFHNFRHAEVLDDLHAIHAVLRRFNPKMQLLLTVSPVPLTATATDAHVLNATSQSKATLRAAVGEFLVDTKGTDYFPSYEIITQPSSGGPWFGPNMRSIRPEGVAKVMQIFCAAHTLPFIPNDAPASTILGPDVNDDDIQCEEILLEAFAK